MKTLEIISNSDNYEFNSYEAWLASHSPCAGSGSLVTLVGTEEDFENLYKAYQADEEDSSVVWDIVDWI